MNLIMLGLTARQPRVCSAQCVAEPKDVGSGSSREPYVLGLRAYLNPRILGLVTRQTYIYLGSTRS
jgi:hypothetical protein